MCRHLVREEGEHGWFRVTGSQWQGQTKLSVNQDPCPTGSHTEARHITQPSGFTSARLGTGVLKHKVGGVPHPPAQGTLNSTPQNPVAWQVSASRGRNDGWAFLPAGRTLHPASLWERAGSPGSHVSMATRMLACQWSRTHTALWKDEGLSPEWGWSGSLDNAQGLARTAKSLPACWPVPTQCLLAKGKPAHL